MLFESNRDWQDDLRLARIWKDSPTADAGLCLAGHLLEYYIQEAMALKERIKKLKEDGEENVNAFKRDIDM